MLLAGQVFGPHSLFGNAKPESRPAARTHSRASCTVGWLAGDCGSYYPPAVSVVVNDHHLIGRDGALGALLKPDEARIELLAIKRVASAAP